MEKQQTTRGRAMTEGTRTPTEGVLIRFDPQHLKLVSEAADYLGLPRSAWMRATVIREAREVLAGKLAERQDERERRVAAK
jgi:uncharacterized protein (DUF1778 family)